jgi:putative PIN family toxin of toxin-antitoxin system
VPARAVLDANVYISYLLNPRPDATIPRIVELLFSRAFELIVPEQVIDELTRVAARPHLAVRIPGNEVDLLVEQLGHLGERVPRAGRGKGVSVRDPDDLYLIESALETEADFLVTGDLDLLALREALPRPRIVTPGQFLEILESSEQ